MMEISCKHGANVECTKGKHAQTPLMTAINTAHFKVVEVLLCDGAEVGKCNKEGTNCWDMAWHNRDMQVFWNRLTSARAME